MLCRGWSILSFGEIMYSLIAIEMLGCTETKDPIRTASGAPCPRNEGGLVLDIGFEIHYVGLCNID
jgi:hypothetical protein